MKIKNLNSLVGLVLLSLCYLSINSPQSLANGKFNTTRSNRDRTAVISVDGETVFIDKEGIITACRLDKNSKEECTKLDPTLNPESQKGILCRYIPKVCNFYDKLAPYLSNKE